MGLTTKEISSSSFNDMISSVDRRSEYVENRAGANVRLNNFLTPYTLDDKSSILNAPCGYSNGVYPSLRPVGGENLLSYSNDFSQWVNVNTTETGGQTGYDGSSNAWLIEGTATNGRIEKSVTSNTSVLTASVYAKAGTTNIIRLRQANPNISVDYDLSTGTFVSVIGSGIIDHNITSVGNGWYRIDITGQGTLVAVSIYPIGASGSSIYIQDAQLEKGYRATPYTDTTTSPAINADFTFSRGSAATRVTKDGLVKNVQILSDELVQNGNFEQIGSEEVTNGSFDNSLSWGMQSSWSISNGSANYDGISSHYIEQSNVFSANTNYKITFTISNNTSGIISIRDGAAATLVPNTNYTNGTYTFYIKSNTNTTLRIYGVGGSGALSIDNVSVKEVGQNWTFGTGWSIEDGVVSADAPTGNLDQSLTATSGSKYRVTFTISNYVSGDIRWRFTGTSNENGTLRSANGTYTEEITLTNSQSIFRFPATGGVMDIDNISVIEVTDDTNLPRIDYTNGTGSLLLEPQSTNLIAYSEDFSQWAKFGLTTESDYLSPSGDTNATKITATTTDPYIYYNVNVTAVTHTASVYVKGVGNTVGKQGRILFWYIGTATGSTTSIPFTLTSEWQRVDGSSTPTGAGTLAVRVDFPADTAEVGDVGYLYGFQCEPLSYATSYIPTNGSTVTRNADVCNNAGSSDLINSTEGVLYFEFKPNSTDTSSLNLSDGSSNNFLQIYIPYNTTNLRYRLSSNGVSQFDRNLSTSTDLSLNNKYAFKWKLNDYSLWVNGSKLDTHLTGSTPIGMNSINFYSVFSNLQKLNGRVRSVAVFKEALTDEELAKITSTTQQEAFYEMRDKMLQINADYYEFGDYTTRLKKLF